jgi:hypothetical protein
MTSESELLTYATACAQSITVRTYDSTGCHDTERPSTAEEQHLLCSIIYGALLAVEMDGADRASVRATAEYIAGQLLPQANCCVTDELLCLK